MADSHYPAYNSFYFGPSVVRSVIQNSCIAKIEASHKPYISFYLILPCLNYNDPESKSNPG